MKTKQREVKFEGGPLDGVTTTRFGDGLREMGAFWVTHYHGRYQADCTVVTDFEMVDADQVALGESYDLWTWKED